MSRNKKMLKDKDILSFYQYLYEYEAEIKNEYGRFCIDDNNVNQFVTGNNIFLGSINNKNDIRKSTNYDNFILWEEGAINSKSNKDRAHALLRRIRNAFAHGKLIDKKSGFFELSDYDDKKQKDTLHGIISYQLLYELIDVLKETKK